MVKHQQAEAGEQEEHHQQQLDSPSSAPMLRQKAPPLHMFLCGPFFDLSIFLSRLLPLEIREHMFLLDPWRRATPRPQADEI